MIPKAYWAYISVLGSKIPPKKNSTPIKPSEYSTMTHEYEELQHDLSKLQDQVHQISLSQRATKNERQHGKHEEWSKIIHRRFAKVYTRNVS